MLGRGRNSQTLKGHFFFCPREIPVRFVMSQRAGLHNSALPGTWNKQKKNLKGELFLLVNSARGNGQILVLGHFK